MKTPLKLRIEPYLDDLKAKKVTNRQVAVILGVTESWVSKVLKKEGIVRQNKHKRAEKRQLRQARLLHRHLAADTMSIQEAAKACNVHPRTITRLLKAGNPKPQIDIEEETWKILASSIKPK